MLNEDFSELLALFAAHDVRYMVIGGFAVAFHGHPRYTKDIDLWIDNSPENAKKVLDCLALFGFASLGLKVEDFTSGDAVVQLGYPPRRIDLITGIEGLCFSEVYSAHETMVIGNVAVRYVDLQGLIQTKRIAGRLQDLADIEKLGGSQAGAGKTKHAREPPP
jgi:hypothetical protein